jgi:hypothetical protein
MNMACQCSPFVLRCQLSSISKNLQVEPHIHMIQMHTYRPHSSRPSIREYGTGLACPPSNLDAIRHQVDLPPRSLPRRYPRNPNRSPALRSEQPHLLKPTLIQLSSNSVAHSVVRERWFWAVSLRVPMKNTPRKTRHQKSALHSSWRRAQLYDQCGVVVFNQESVGQFGQFGRLCWIDVLVELFGELTRIRLEKVIIYSHQCAALSTGTNLSNVIQAPA